MLLPDCYVTLVSPEPTILQTVTSQVAYPASPAAIVGSTAAKVAYPAYVPRRSGRGYDRPVARRPSDERQRRVEEQGAELAQGTPSPEDTYASGLWPKSLRVSTDAALAAFEDELRALAARSDAEVLAVVKRVALALNKVNEQHIRAGPTGYETDEREELCDYIKRVAGGIRYRPPGAGNAKRD